MQLWGGAVGVACTLALVAVFVAVAVRSDACRRNNVPASAYEATAARMDADLEGSELGTLRSTPQSAKPPSSFEWTTTSSARPPPPPMPSAQPLPPRLASSEDARLLRLSDGNAFFPDADLVLEARARRLPQEASSDCAPSEI